MDGLSAAASIVALCQLTNEIVQYLNHARHAPEECQQCIIEASNLLGPLISLRFRAEQAKSGDPWFEELRNLNVQDGPLDQYKEALELLRKRIEIGDGIQKVKRQLLWRFNKEQVTGILQRIERLKSLVSIALEMDHRKLSDAIKDDTACIRASLPPLQASATAIEEGVRALLVETSSVKDDTSFIRDALPPLQVSADAVRDAQSSEQHQKLVEWLSPTDFAAQQHDIIARRQEGTGQWFIDSTEFKQWQRGLDKTLFCPGMPGAGKTMLAAAAVDYLYKTTLSDDVGIACVFCSYKSLVDQTATNLLASILKQLIRDRPGIASPVRGIYNHHSTRGTKPSLDELAHTLLSVCSSVPTVYIVLDALDECTNTDNVRRQLIGKLRSLQVNANVRLLFTSRPIPDVTQDFQFSPSLKIHAVDEDVRRYVAGQVPRLPKCIQRDDDLKNTVQTKILEAVDGMFLLARLHVDSLLDKRNKERVLSTLDKLSKGSTALEDAYSEALRRIDGQLNEDSLLAKRALCWISYAQRPLTVPELCCAMAIEPGDKALNRDNLYEVDDIIDVCAGLVTIDEDSGIVRLVHYTTQEYFERVRLEWHPHAQEEIAIACLTYLSFEVFKTGSCTSNDEFEQRMIKNKFLGYAACHWHEHVRPVEASTTDLALAFLHDKALVDSASEVGPFSDFSSVTSHYRFINPQTTGLHLAAKHGLLYLTEKLFAAKCGVDKVEVDAKDYYGRTPMWLAVSYGHEQVFKLLHSEGACLSVRHHTFGDMLQLASYHEQEAFVKLLLELGAEVNLRGGGYGTALQAASFRGNAVIVKLLLDADADVKLQGGKYGTALQAASAGASEKIAKLLLDAGADVNAQGGCFDTPLQAASCRGKEVIVTQLLEAGADTNLKGGYCGSALHAASAHGHEEVARLLLDRGANATVEIPSGWLPFQTALVRGHERIASMLLEAMENECKEGVDAAAPNTNESLSQGMPLDVLLPTALPKGLQEVNGWSLLHWACRTAEPSVIDMMLKSGLQDEYKLIGDPPGNWSAYSIAVFHNNRQLVRPKATAAEAGMQCTIRGFLESKVALKTGLRNGGYWCDGCAFDIYGPRFHCLSCDDFDYCFMCNAFARRMHDDHEFERFDPED